MEEEKKELTVIDKNKLPSKEEVIALLPEEEAEGNMATSIIKSESSEELQKYINIFNLNQSKKNALRILKLNGLLDKLDDEAIERLEKRPGEISNKEILDYMTIVANQIDRSQKYVDTMEQKPMIKLTQNNTEINVNLASQLDRDSKDKVINAIQTLLSQAKNSGYSMGNPIEEEPIDVNESPLTEEDSEDNCIDN